jgi:plastocyanin
VRRLLPFAILGACLAVGVLPALAANQSVAIDDSSFSPARVAVLPGETVHWEVEPGYSGPAHNVHFDGEAALGPPSAAFNESKSFPTEGAYAYHCDVHAFMNGTVYVNQTGTVPTPSQSGTPTANPTASPSATPTTPAGGSGVSGSGGGAGGGQSGPVGSTTAPVFSFRLKATVRKRRVVLTLTVSAGVPVRVRGTLRRGKKRVRRVTVLGRPGRHKVKLPGKALKPGRYTLTLRAGELKRTVRFRIRRA